MRLEVRNKISSTIAKLHQTTNLWKNYDKEKYDSRRGENHYKWKGELKKYNCKYCGKLNTFSAYKNNTSFCNKKCMTAFQRVSYPLETKDKISKTLTGRKLPLNVRKKQRESAIKNIGKFKFDGKKIKITIGKYEKGILDYLQTVCLTYPILRQYTIDGYFIDGYCPTLNLAIEIDEKYHRNSQIKDIERQQYITNMLKCDFLRINVGD
jgi:very-short-patch-repair endonuclease